MCHVCCTCSAVLRLGPNTKVYGNSARQVRRVAAGLRSDAIVPNRAALPVYLPHHPGCVAALAQAGGLFLQSLLDNMTYADAITQRNKAV